MLYDPERVSDTPTIAIHEGRQVPFRDEQHIALIEGRFEARDRIEQGKAVPIRVGQVNLACVGHVLPGMHPGRVRCEIESHVFTAEDLHVPRFSESRSGMVRCAHRYLTKKVVFWIRMERRLSPSWTEPY